jgi:phosphoribosyl 1,2-cyclic phosphodiesterase
VGCLEKLLRKHAKAVWMSHGTHVGMGAPDLGPLLHLAQDNTPIDLGNLQLHPFTVPHDAREPLQLSVTDGSVRLGIVTDLGHVTPHGAQQLQGCHAVMLECNHDPDMLASSSYPPFLKRRVGGQLGHLSNEQAAALAQALCHDGLRHLVASHLSERNNVPELARNVLAAATGRLPQDIGVADPVQGTDWLHA